MITTKRARKPNQSVKTAADLEKLAKRCGYKNAKEALAARLKVPVSQVGSIGVNTRNEVAKWLNNRVGYGPKAGGRARAPQEASPQLRLFNPTGKALIGKTVDLKPSTHYAGHWGIVIAYDGDRYYTVSKGSIGDLAPIFTRDEFTVRKSKSPAKRNPASEGVTTARQWAYVTGLISRHRDVNAGRASYSNDPEVLEAVEMIRATPKSRRTEFAKAAASRRRRNPEAEAEDLAIVAKADQLYEAFTGKAAQHITEIDQPVHFPPDMAELGKLIELVVILPNDGTGDTVPGRVINFEGRGVVLAGAGFEQDRTGIYGTELHFAGGNQALSLKDLDAEAQSGKPTVVIGEAFKLTYAAKKHFHNFSLEHYEHKLGEESGIRPLLCYDPRSKLMFLSGGNYQIRPEGITD